MYDLDHAQADIGDLPDGDTIHNPDTDQGNALFHQWIQEVNNCIAADMMGLTSEDLPDIAYMDLFEDGYEPSEAAEAALENAGWEG